MEDSGVARQCMGIMFPDTSIITILSIVSKANDYFISVY